MHEVFEVAEAILHIGHIDGTDPIVRDDITALRLGIVLTGLAAMPQARVMSATEAWSWLKQADEADLLQVFLDTDGIGRGYAIFSLLNDDTDALARSDPRVVATAGCRRDGDNVWITALAGGVGQGFAIARQLKEGFLRHHSEVKYIKRVNSQPMLKSLIRLNQTINDADRTKIRVPAASVRFTQLRLSFSYIKKYAQYIKILNKYNKIISLKRASENFYHAASLQQYEFNNDDAPSAYVSWCMVDQDTFDRLSVEGTSDLEPGDWSCGDLRLDVDVLGEITSEDCSSLLRRQDKTPTV